LITAAEGYQFLSIPFTGNNPILLQGLLRAINLGIDSDLLELSQGNGARASQLQSSKIVLEQLASPFARAPSDQASVLTVFDPENRLVALVPQETGFVDDGVPIIFNHPDALPSVAIFSGSVRYENLPIQTRLFISSDTTATSQNTLTIEERESVFADVRSEARAVIQSTDIAQTITNVLLRAFPERYLSVQFAENGSFQDADRFEVTFETKTGNFSFVISENESFEAIEARVQALADDAQSGSTFRELHGFESTGQILINDNVTAIEIKPYFGDRQPAPLPAVTTPRSESRELTKQDLEVIQTVITQFTAGVLSLADARQALQIEDVDGARIREAVLVATGIGLITEDSEQVPTALDELIESLGGKERIGLGQSLTDVLNQVEVTSASPKGYVAVPSAAALAEADLTPDSFWDKLMKAEEGLVVLIKDGESVNEIVGELIRKLNARKSFASAELKNQAEQLINSRIMFKNQAQLNEFIEENQGAVALLDTGHDSALFEGIRGGFRFILKDGQKPLGSKNFWASTVVSVSLVQAMRMVRGLGVSEQADAEIIKLFNEHLKLNISKTQNGFEFGLLDDLLQQIVVAKYIEIMA